MFLNLISNKRFLVSTFCAWLIFIMIDFFFHATVLTHFWLDEQLALKTLTDLAVLIPAGYGSFLILTVFCGWLYYRVFSEIPSAKKEFGFTFLFAGLFTLSNLFGMYSYINLPFVFIVLINVVYFVEIVAVVMIFSWFRREGELMSKVWKVLLIFLAGMIVSILIQNIFGTYQSLN